MAETEIVIYFHRGRIYFCIGLARYDANLKAEQSVGGDGDKRVFFGHREPVTGSAEQIPRQFPRLIARLPHRASPLTLA